MKNHGQNALPQTQNLQFELPNRLMANYISALGIAAEMEEKAKIDPLTSLHNRRALEETYIGLQGSEVYRRNSDASHDKEAGKHSLLMLDVDFFKSVNDSLGHDEGNRVLQEVADVMSKRIRKRDLAARVSDAARIGGEEFAVLLPRTRSEQATKVAEDIRQLIEKSGTVTVSIGVADVDLGQTLEENLSRADSALYAAKEQGRNRVVQYEPSLAQ